MLRFVPASLRRATGYPSFQSNSSQRSPSHHATFPPQTARRIHALLRFRSGQRLRSFLSSAIPYALLHSSCLRSQTALGSTQYRFASTPMLIPFQMPLARLHTTGISQLRTQILTHNVGLCRIPRCIPSGRRRRLTICSTKRAALLYPMASLR